ncbi:uncharacterized protein JCM6883_006220 [Sporobolomyces salmoneus]|uniref:uncharacterized protein n=1 Tax=Sporobolomyces salmoneus TaxID=183962 RepID=UPI00317BE422
MLTQPWTSASFERSIQPSRTSLNERTDSRIPKVDSPEGRTLRDPAIEELFARIDAKLQLFEEQQSQTLSSIRKDLESARRLSNVESYGVQRTAEEIPLHLPLPGAPDVEDALPINCEPAPSFVVNHSTKRYPNIDFPDFLPLATDPIKSVTAVPSVFSPPLAPTSGAGALVAGSDALCRLFSSINHDVESEELPLVISPSSSTVQPQTVTVKLPLPFTGAKRSASQTEEENDDFESEESQDDISSEEVTSDDSSQDFQIDSDDDEGEEEEEEADCDSVPASSNEKVTKLLMAYLLAERKLASEAETSASASCGCKGATVEEISYLESIE